MSRATLILSFADIPAPRGGFKTVSDSGSDC